MHDKHTHTRLRVSRYHKGKTNLDFTEDWLFLPTYKYVKVSVFDSDNMVTLSVGLTLTFRNMPSSSSLSSDNSGDSIPSIIAPLVNKQMCINKAVQQTVNSNFG